MYEANLADKRALRLGAFWEPDGLHFEPSHMDCQASLHNTHKLASLILNGVSWCIYSHTLPDIPINALGVPKDRRRLRHSAGLFGFPHKGSDLFNRLP